MNLARAWSQACRVRMADPSARTSLSTWQTRLTLLAPLRARDDDQLPVRANGQLACKVCSSTQRTTLLQTTPNRKRSQGSNLASNPPSTSNYLDLQKDRFLISACVPGSFRQKTGTGAPAARDWREAQIPSRLTCTYLESP